MSYNEQDSLIESFLQVDNAVNSLNLRKLWGSRHYQRGLMTPHEIIFLVIWYHQQKLPDLKSYHQHISQHYRAWFPALISYPRFVAWLPKAYLAIKCLLDKSLAKAGETYYYIVDSTPLPVCKLIRASRHKTCKEASALGYSTIETRFYGLKLTVLINAQGDLVRFSLDAGNTDDRVPLRKDNFIEPMKNTGAVLLADSGYVSSALKKELALWNVRLQAKPRKDQLVQFSEEESLQYKKRCQIETVIGVLKGTVFKLGQGVCRSLANFKGRVVAALLAYTFARQG